MSDERKYSVIVEAVDGRHILHKDLTYDDAKEKTEEWLGRKIQPAEVRDKEKSTTVVGAVSDVGSVIFIERHISDVADQLWMAVSYSWRVTFETLSELRKTDDILEDYLDGLSDEQIKQGFVELEAAGFISPEKAV